MTFIAAKWTTDDYHRMIAAGILCDRKVELLKGEIVEMSPEGEAHAYRSHQADKYLTVLLSEIAEVRQAKPITLPNDSEPEPDIAIVQPLGREYLEHHPYVENIFWVIEYSNSTLEKDLERKSKIYAEAGIQEYWVVNLKTLHLIVFREPLNGDYATKFTLSTGTIKPLAFGDVDVLVERIINK
ncbi:MAG: Uma2 family endonuclease [Cyanobacteriota bacterium]|nr:Uma2 family endonuclease [Cyanobacteriota bacterium]